MQVSPNLWGSAKAGCVRHKCGLPIATPRKVYISSRRAVVSDLRSSSQLSAREWIRPWLEQKARSRSIPQVSAREWIQPWLDQKKARDNAAVDASVKPSTETSSNGAVQQGLNGASPSVSEAPQQMSARAWIRPWLLKKRQERSQAVLEELRNRVALLSKDEQDKAIARMLAKKNGAGEAAPAGEAAAPKSAAPKSAAPKAAAPKAEEAPAPPAPEEAPEQAPVAEAANVVPEPEPATPSPEPPAPKKSPYDACRFEPDGSAVYTAEALAKREYKEVLEACWFSPNM